ncbi:unnamed protein product [Strongylus vulgaris]|uniref:Uncharacterized protein n=1 Tax=Strongylus vulgaris TaxID=40348 RepID=A0A3P7K4J7_STRVU|nr:unnamed protein product [Strongylus vulgaris]
MKQICLVWWWWWDDLDGSGSDGRFASPGMAGPPGIGGMGGGGAGGSDFFEPVTIRTEFPETWIFIATSTK